MTSAWTPPPLGAPCWFSIPALSVPRCRDFYATVFDWTFKASSAEHSEEEMALPQFTGLGALSSAGIVKVSAEEHVKGRGGPLLYLLCDTIEKSLERVHKAGGKTVMEKTKEGGGWCALFEDLEGNVLGIYTLTE